MKDSLKKQSKPLDEISKSCLSYFKDYPVWKKVLEGFREKYFSYGSFSGSVVLSKLNDNDIDVLEGFFQKSFRGQKTVTISAKRFTKALSNSRFDKISPEMLLNMYFSEEIKGKKDILTKRKLLWEKDRLKLLLDNNNMPCESWIESLEFESYTNEELKLCAKMINTFPIWSNKREYLAIFAAEITGYPHEFDKGTRSRYLLDQVIKWHFKREVLEDERNIIFNSHEEQRLYLRAGILMDDVSNYAMLFGIRALKKDGAIHEGIDGFYNENDMIQLPLKVIASLGKVKCKNNRLYVVENPSIYAMLYGMYGKEISCMCMNGQPRLSSLIILDILEEGTEVYYAGDFDPEGLLIAQKISRYYSGKVNFWAMTEEQYIKSMSDEILNDRRIKSLDNIDNLQLIPIANKMRETKKAGYQENIDIPNI